MDQENPPGIPTQEIKTAWTTERAAHVLFLTFRFSQGDEILQSNLFDYLHAANPTLKIPQGAFNNEVFNKARLFAKKFLFPQGLKGEEVPKEHNFGDPPNMDIVLQQIDHNLSDMRKRFDEPDDTTTNEIIPSIVDGLLLNDSNYLSRGRPRGNPDPSNPKRDPYSSFLIDYGLKGTKTGLTEFDQMFSEVKVYLERERDQQTERWLILEPKVTDVITKYNEHHPENKFSFTKSSPDV